MMQLTLAFLLFVNAVRGGHDLVPDPDLVARAQIRADYLCASHQFNHDNWEIFLAGYPYSYAGENLAHDFNYLPEPERNREIEHAFEMSPEHLSNIVNTNYTRFGVAKGDCGVYVQLFAKRV